MSCTRMTTLAFLLFELLPFVLFEIDFMSEYPSDILMTFGRMQNRTRRRVKYKNDNSVFLTFGVISLCYSGSDYR